MNLSVESIVNVKTALVVAILLVSASVFLVNFTTSAQAQIPATRSWNSGEPGDLRVFVNSLAAQEGYSLVPSVLRYDSATAQKVCQLAG
ncbi:MAG: hypothetical protein Q8P73_00740, partial [bacterium]|nr:hypothetical protein [bacterium]